MNSNRWEAIREEMWLEIAKELTKFLVIWQLTQGPELNPALIPPVLHKICFSHLITETAQENATRAHIWKFIS